MEKVQNSFSMRKIGGGFLMVFILLITSCNSSPTISSPNGKNKFFEFKDGSTVLLNDGTKLSYDKGSWDETRTLDLDGEAYFQVVKDYARFIIRTNKGQVGVVETARFNIINRGDKVSVECYEGQVIVVQGDLTLTLLKGQGVELASEGGNPEHRMISHNAPYWQNGESNYIREDVNVVLEELGRQYDVRIENPGMFGVYTGQFPHDSLELAINNVCNRAGLKFEISDNQKTIRILPDN